ncbi:MAG: DNA-binding protein [Candidatus Aenigmarchaeota archaeon]|nr:DNA-binding protein [Candidatus Aenigmarchaeota archaeon]
MNGESIDPEKFQQMKQIEELKKQVLSSVLERDAFERLARVRIVNPQLAGQIELYLVQVYQAGQIKGKISDEKLKGLLQMISQKRETKIKRA